MPLLNPNMTNDQKAAALGAGSRGATVACLELCQLSAQYLDMIDELGLSGSVLYGIWNDVCNRDTRLMGLLIVAGYSNVAGINHDTLVHAADNRGDGIDLDEVIRYMQNIADQVPWLFR